jgi:ABC-type proline/glycine betaine transport system ATPase subunit
MIHALDHEGHQQDLSRRASARCVDFSLQRGEIHALARRKRRGQVNADQGAHRRGTPDAGVIDVGRPRDRWPNRRIMPRRWASARSIRKSISAPISRWRRTSCSAVSRTGWAASTGAGSTPARRDLEWLEVDIDVKQSVGMYPVAIQQMVAISRALEISAKVLILDEPTSSLAAHETEKLFAVMRKLKHEGIGVIFITHFLDQVYRISDRITVLRNGKLVGAYETAALPRVELVARMIGRDLTELEEMGRYKQAAAVEESAVVAAGPGVWASRLDRAVRPGTAQRRSRRVGWSAWLRAHGDWRTCSSASTNRTAARSPWPVHSRARIIHRCARSSQAMAYCPEDRKADGIVGELTVRENIMFWLCRPAAAGSNIQSGQTARDRRQIHQAAQHQHPNGRTTGQELERRQPAEGDPGALAGHRPGHPDPGRADARHRHRRQGGNSEAGADVGEAKARPASSFPRSWTKCCARATACWCCATTPSSPNWARVN